MFIISLNNFTVGQNYMSKRIWANVSEKIRNLVPF